MIVDLTDEEVLLISDALARLEDPKSPRFPSLEVREFAVLLRAKLITERHRNGAGSQ